MNRISLLAAILLLLTFSSSIYANQNLGRVFLRSWNNNYLSVDRNGDVKTQKSPQSHEVFECILYQDMELITDLKTDIKLLKAQVASLQKQIDILSSE